MEAQTRRSDDVQAYYSLNRRVYPALAPFYDLVTFPIRRLRREVASMAGVGPSSRVLDVATGTGAQALAFAESAREVVGIDISGPMLRIARRKNRRPSVTFLQADATKLPFEDGSFDVACISFALHEMPGSVRERAVREMMRVLRPGGTFVAVDYALPQNPVAASAVYRLVKLYERDLYADFIRSDLPALLRGAGVRVEEDRQVLRGTVRIVKGSAWT